jgi:copper chaperone CopZ
MSLIYRSTSVALFCLLLIGGGSLSLSAQDAIVESDTVQQDTVQYSAQDSVTFKLSDLLCQLCAVHLHNELKKVEGVIENEVSFEEKEAFVKYDPNKTGLVELVQVIEDAGYGATIK